MPRRVIKTAHQPFVLQPQTTPATICMCGLSKNQPFCDGSHAKTLDEDPNKLYEYDDQGNRKEV